MSVEFADAFASKAWTAQDPATDDWIVGSGNTTLTKLSLGHGHANAAWDNTAFTSDLDGRTTAGIVDAAGLSREWAVEVDIDTGAARIDRSGTRLFVHAGRDGKDRGVMMIDTATGSLTNVVPPGSVKVGYVRNYLVWSPTGNTLMSSLCDLEGCFVDIIDTASAISHRLPESFPALLVTDRYVFGRVEGGLPWRAWDLIDGKEVDVPLDGLLNPHVAVALDDQHVLIDDYAATSYRILRVSLATGEVTTAYEDGAADVNGLRLMRMAPIDGRWAMLGAVESISDQLALDGTYPAIFGLDTSIGTVATEGVSITPVGD